MGKHYQSQRQFGDSLYPLKKCSSLDPSSDNLASYGSALFDYGNIDGALKTLKKAVDKDEKNKKALYYYGLTLAWVFFSAADLSFLDIAMRGSGIDIEEGTQDGDSREQLLHCSLYDTYFPPQSDTCYDAKGNGKKAQEMNRRRDRSILPGPGTALAFLSTLSDSFNKAVAELNSGDYSACHRHLQEVLSTYPSMSECYYIMGKAFLKQSDASRSVVALEKAASLVKRGFRLEVQIIDLFTALYDAYVAQIPPDHNGGLRAEQQMLSLYPRDLRQLFSYYHIKQYTSSLDGLPALLRHSMQAFQKEEKNILIESDAGKLPPITPIRASVMASVSEQNEINAVYERYILARIKGETRKRTSIRSRDVRSVLRVGLLSGDVYFNHPMMHLMRRAFRYLHVGESPRCFHRAVKCSLLIPLRQTRPILRAFISNWAFRRR